MRIVCSGGGTGGHIYPAIAVAKEVEHRYPDAEVLFVGATGKMEMEIVPKVGYRIEGLWISGLQRRLTWKNLVWPFKVLSSVMKARKILRSFRPNIVIGFGGYASGAALWAATKLSLPTLIQEQNSFAGITNKILSKRVDRICVAYENALQFFPSDRTVVLGNPIRKLEVTTTREQLCQQFGLQEDSQVVLIAGGSLGAKSINQALIDNYDLISQLEGVEILWQCGKLYLDQCEQSKTAQLSYVQVHEFIDNMAGAYRVADVVASRAGALTISELQSSGKASILIPSPNVAEDHQTKNARALSERRAALLLHDDDLSQSLIPSIQ
ncbi:MAG: undecaprenyldiphospho-muramoylpentapeptide beta-N-acetylglucosaminyltransferase, partial [Bacteroidota bacterium]